MELDTISFPTKENKNIYTNRLPKKLKRWPLFILDIPFTAKKSTVHYIEVYMCVPISEKENR